jgi:hypothetical protein
MWVSTLPRSRHVVAYAPRYRRTPMVSTNPQLNGLGASAAVTGVKAAYTGAGVGAALTGTTVAGAIGAGAAAGSVVPVIGTAIGAVVALLASGVLSHHKAPEDANFQQAMQMADSQGPLAVLNVSNKYLVLAGLFDLLPGQIKGNIPIYKKYGRMGEQRFVTDLMTLVYQAAQSGRITANDTSQSIMARIVQPWIDSWGYGPMQDHNAQMLNMILMGMIAEYAAGLQTSWLARGGQNPFGSLPPFGFPAAAPPPQQVPQPPVTVQQAVQTVAAPAAAVAAVTSSSPVTTSSSGGPAPQSTGAANMGMPTVVPVPVSAAGQVDMQGLVQQLLAQGQTQQQAFNSAMASMQAAGVQPTPQVQQATAQAVQAQSAGAGGMFSGMGSMGGIAIVAAMALASFALARPVGRTPSRRRS